MKKKRRITRQDIKDLEKTYPTQKAMAKALGVAPYTIRRWKTGVRDPNRSPQARRLRALITRRKVREIRVSKLPFVDRKQLQALRKEWPWIGDPRTARKGVKYEWYGTWSIKIPRAVVYTRRRIGVYTFQELLKKGPRRAAEITKEIWQEWMNYDVESRPKKPRDIKLVEVFRHVKAAR